MDDNTQDEEVLRQIEREVRMREGASKLLAACSRREQALEVSKSLLTCNTRILALLSQLQKMRKAQILQRVGRRLSEDIVPCLGKVALSDLRIPLMWKDSEYFKNKGELHRCAVFCLLQCGTEIHDTDLVMVDRTLTDICFEDTVIFNEVGPGFQLRVELYSSCEVEEFSAGALGPRRVSRLGGSLGCSSGKKIRAAFESATVCGSISGGGDEDCVSPPFSPYPSALGPKYNLLAHATLRMEHVQESFKTHDLSLAATEDSPFWLPLYGNMCCRLVAQPLCVIQTVISGQLKVKLGEDLNCWQNVYGVLRGQSLHCYQSREDLESEDKPLFVIPVKKDSLVCVSEIDPDHCQRIYISTQHQGEDVTYMLTTHTPEDTQRWTEVLGQHVYNINLRIPLMWKDSEYFKNKGELHRCAVFCLLQCGTEIHDTDLVMVDRTLTDICFEDTVIFNEVGPGFQLRVELYSSCEVEEFSAGALGPRRVSRLGGSLGCSSGKKIRAAFESATVCGSISGGGDEDCVSPPFSPYPSALGPKYNLLAHATLRMEHVQESFKTHDLSLAATEDSPFWLPLYGNMCCRLVAQPLCVIQTVISGQLKVKLGEDLNCWQNVYGVLRGQSLHCYQSREDLESEDKPLFVIPVKKDSLVCVSEIDPDHCQRIYISTQHQGEDVTYMLTTHTPEDTQRWTEVLGQHVYNISQWKQCCDHLMKIEMLSSRKPITVKQGSLYHEIVSPSSPREGLVVPDLSVEIRTLLSSYYNESY